jgi:hypothetical protein
MCTVGKVSCRIKRVLHYRHKYHFLSETKDPTVYKEFACDWLLLNYEYCDTVRLTVFAFCQHTLIGLMTDASLLFCQ